MKKYKIRAISVSVLLVLSILMAFFLPLMPETLLAETRTGVVAGGDGQGRRGTQIGNNNSGTYGYLVDSNGDGTPDAGPAICVTPNAASPSGQYGTETSHSDGSTYTSEGELAGYSVSQVYVGTMTWLQGDLNGRWTFAHAFLSAVYSGDLSWIGRYPQGAIDGYQRAIATIIDSRNISRFATYYTWHAEGVQVLVTLVRGTPTERPTSAYVNILKRDSQTQTGLAGATIRFTCDQGASGMTGVTANVGTTPIGDNGFTYVSPTSNVQVRGLHPNCTYRVQETTPPSGYQLSSHEFVVSVNGDGVVSIDGVATTTAQINIDNPPEEGPADGSVIFHKVGEDGNNLQGAHITFTSYGNSVPNPMENITFTAGAGVDYTYVDGVLTFVTSTVSDQMIIRGLKPGAQYIFHETHAPEGYIADLDQIVTVDAEGNVTPNNGHVTFRDSTNNNRYGSLRFFKFVDDQVSQMVDSVFLYIYQEGHDAPFLTAQSSGSMRGSGQNSFGFGSGNVSAGQISDASHMHFYSEGWTSYDWVDFNNDGIQQPDEIVGTNHPGIYDFVNPETGTGGYWCYWVEGLPESMYTIVEDWIVGSIVDMTTQERIAVEGMNYESGWQKLPSYVDADGNYHVQFSTQVLIAYTGGMDAGLNHHTYNGVFMPNYGAIPINNSEASFGFDVTKIQKHGDASDLSFQLWSMSGSTPRNHIANGAVTTSAIADNTYSVNWTYQLLYPGASAPTTLNNVDYVNHLPLGVYQLREYATNINAYAVPDGWERITDSTGTYFATTIDYTNVSIGHGNHPVQTFTFENKTGQIIAYKVDEWTGEVLRNYEGPYDATFALYADVNNNGVLDSSDTFVAQRADTDRNGMVEFLFEEVFPGVDLNDIPGHLLVVETVAPYGYYLNNTAIPVDVTEVKAAEVRCVDTPYTAQIEVTKVDGDTSEFLSNAQFTVYVDRDNNGLFTDGVDTIAQTFNGTSMVNATFTYNAATNCFVSSPLRPGNYVVVETGLPDGYFYVDDNGLPSLTPNEAFFSIENRDTSLPGFTVGRYQVTEYNLKPEIHTTLTSPITNAHVAPVAPTTELVDEVFYHNLVPNQEYQLTGTLYDKKTGEPIRDRSGNVVTATTVFTPTEPTGTTTVTFTLDTQYIIDLVAAGSMGAPAELVAFEDLRFTNGREVCIHADINDEDQTVTVGRVETSAGSSDSAGISTIRSANGLVTIVDRCDYQGLAPHTTYRFYGELHLVGVREDGTKYDAGAIQPRPNETTYRWVEFTTGDSHEGYVDVTFVIDAARFKGQDIVCFEYVYQGEQLIMWHADIESTSQTTHVPGVASQAFCTDTCTQVVPYVEMATVTDTIYYSNLEPTYYELTGTLNWVRHNPDGSVDTGMIEGAGGASYTVFTVEEGHTSGTVEMTFRFDPRPYIEMGCDQIVVFEHLTHNGQLLAKDADLNNHLQTLTLVQLHTNANDVSTGSQTFAESATAQVHDRVTYTGLTPGQQYTVSGSLQYVITDREGHDLHSGILEQNGQPVTAEVTFVPTTPNGEIEMVFNVDVTDLINRNVDRVVAFERIWGGAGILLSIHEDLNDRNQTVEVCDLHTTATVGGTHSADASSSVTLVDRVAFEGLSLGREYRIESSVMRHSTGEAIAHKTTVFTATTSDGYIDVEMTFDASRFSSDEYVVVFEDGYDNQTNILIRSHHNWNDQNQTVTFGHNPNLTPTPTPRTPGIPSTGEGTDYIELIGVLLLVIGSAELALFLLRRKKNSEDNDERNVN